MDRFEEFPAIGEQFFHKHLVASFTVRELRQLRNGISNIQRPISKHEHRKAVASAMAAIRPSPQALRRSLRKQELLSIPESCQPKPAGQNAPSGGFPLGSAIPGFSYAHRPDPEPPPPGKPTIPMQQRTTTGFPTQRRPVGRDLSTEDPEVINKWFLESGITIGPVADSPERVGRVKQLLFTWKDLFPESMRDVKPTDLIQHCIDLRPDHRPVVHKRKRYTQKEMNFAQVMFPAMEEAGILVRGTSEWGAVVKFPPKKKGSEELRVVHNFIPVNNATIKQQYPMHSLEEVVDMIIRPGHGTFFTGDAANSYWAIPIRAGDEHKAAIITPHGHYLYLRMGQGLSGSPHTYAQYADLVFGPLPKTETIPRMETIIKTKDGTSFAVFMDDHLGSFTDFEKQFDFLHTQYFPRCAFGPIALNPRKFFCFMDHLDMLGFTGSPQGLRPAIRHRDAALLWGEPKCRADVEGFCWLTPFLRMFIPGRADHVRTMKMSYLQEVPVAEDSIRLKLVDTGEFHWGPEQDASFRYVQECIANNSMAGADPLMQFHLATDASKRGLGGVLFQLQGIDEPIEATDKHKKNVRIIMFMSFKLDDAETRYQTTERECLAVIRCLAESRYLVIGSPHATRVYTDHSALDSVLNSGQDAHGRIARWMDRLTEYDYVVHHRSNSANIIRIADGLSRMPGNYLSDWKAEDSERMAATLLPEPFPPNTRPNPAGRSGQRKSMVLSAAGARTLLPEEASGTIVEPTNARSSPHEPAFFLDSDETTVEVPQPAGVPRPANTHPNPPHFGDPNLLAPPFDVLVQSQWYGKLAWFLLGGDAAIQNWTRSDRRWVRRQSLKYKVLGRSLLHREYSGQWAKCLLPHEIDGILHWAHDLHGHYANYITLNQLMGEFYWPTRVKDVDKFVNSCHVCQLDGPKRASTGLRPVLSYGPFSLVGMDFLGPISPVCKVTGSAYVLVVVDYFTKMIWIHGTATAQQEAVLASWSHITPTFGFPEVLFMDNGSHFTGMETKAFFESHGTKVIYAPISHPSSVGQAERMVQLVASQLRRWVLSRGPDAKTMWGCGLNEIQLNVNGRLIRIHGFSPSQLMLGYTAALAVNHRKEPAELMRYDQVEYENTAEERRRADEINFRIVEQVERRDRAFGALARAASNMEKKSTAIWTKPKEGDLVMVRDHENDKNLGGKLEPKWLPPRLLVKVNKSGVSGQVRELYGTVNERKYHLNDLKVYCPRNTVTLAGLGCQPQSQPPAFAIDRMAMSHAGIPGSRAVNLHYPDMV